MFFYIWMYRDIKRLFAIFSFYIAIGIMYHWYISNLRKLLNVLRFLHITWSINVDSEKFNTCRYPVELCEIGHNLHGLKDNNFQA